MAADMNDVQRRLAEIRAQRYGSLLDILLALALMTEMLARWCSAEFCGLVVRLRVTNADNYLSLTGLVGLCCDCSFPVGVFML
jgi:hypothetical protein